MTKITTVQKLTCAERDTILLDPKNGRPAAQWRVYSGLTDISGTYGEPRIETRWQDSEDESIGVKDVRHPDWPTDDYRRNTGEDRKPCEHWLLKFENDEEGS